jgi:hypothetical protein
VSAGEDLVLGPTLSLITGLEDEADGDERCAGAEIFIEEEARAGSTILDNGSRDSCAVCALSAASRVLLIIDHSENPFRVSHYEANPAYSRFSKNVSRAMASL